MNPRFKIFVYVSYFLADMGEHEPIVILVGKLMLDGTSSRSRKRRRAQTLKAWQQFDRLLGIAAVGAGKTIIAAHIIRARQPEGPTLFLAHLQELLDPATDKLERATGIVAAREQAINRAGLSDSVVVASVQSLHAARLEGWSRDHFQTLIIDECHRSAAKIYRIVLSRVPNTRYPSSSVNTRT